MKRGALACVLALAGCSWSNSLYQARQLSSAAERSEREHRPAEAQQYWGQAVVKAESAYARSPRGKRGAEALWLAGQGEARSNDCVRAVPTLQEVFFIAPAARWRHQLLLELGGCAETVDPPTALSVYRMLLASSPDSATRRAALLHQGRALARAGDWAGAADALAGQDTLPARTDRALALAHLGRGDEAVADLAPLLASGDTTVRWIDYVDVLARHDPRAADALLRRLLVLPTVSSLQQSTLLLDAAEAAAPADPDIAARWLDELARRPPSRQVSDGRLVHLQLRIVQSHSLAELAAVLDSATRLSGSEESVAASRLSDLARYGRWIVARNDSIAAGAPAGDLAMFALAELSRDSLGAPGVGAWFFRRLGRDWPRSPYTGKALLARIPLEPDSADALLARAKQDTANPFIAAANGDLAARLEVARLEYALGTFIREWTGAPAAPRPVEGRE